MCGVDSISAEKKCPQGDERGGLSVILRFSPQLHCTCYLKIKIILNKEISSAVSKAFMLKCDLSLLTAALYSDSW